MTISQEKVSLDSHTFRATLGLFATGVTVVAVEIDGIVRGMTANAFTSVSLTPPLVLVCVQKNAHMVEYLKQSSGFSVNILSQEQENLSRFFANMWPAPEPPAFSFQSWVEGPRLEGAIGAIACRTQEFLEGGDHWIIIAEVVDLYRAKSPAAPLLYYAGRYRQLHP